MATDKKFLEYILEQLSELEEISFRGMMGEYLIYYKGKYVAAVCDDRLLMKPVNGAEQLMPDARREMPYEGAKEMLLVEETEDKAFLKKLFEVLYRELPESKKKR